MCLLEYPEVDELHKSCSTCSINHFGPLKIVFVIFIYYVKFWVGGVDDLVGVGGPTIFPLADGGLSTVISKHNVVTSDFLSLSLTRC